ncbi:MAG: hypothetical protein H0X30_19335 [Anaerolineae bacterium]|nr:hypothetical protein [Anaerolineae bacterium]
MMRLKRLLILALCLLISGVFQQITFAQEAPPARTIPITSKGFGAKLSPDGKTLITFENTVLLDLKEMDPTLLPMRVIDMSTGKERGQLSGFSDFTADVAFTRNGSRLISVQMNGDVYIWDMVSLKVMKTFQTPLLGNLQIKLFPDNRRILALLGGIPQRLLVIDTETGGITQSFGKHFESYLEFQANYTQFPGVGDIQFASFALSPDGKILATTTANDEVMLTTLADGQSQLIRQKSEQYALFNIRQLAFTPDGKSLVYYDLADSKTHIWDIAAKSENAALDIGSDTFALSPDSTRIAWVTREKDKPNTLSIAPLDAPDKAKVLLTLPDGLQVAPRITWVTFTPNGKQVVVGGFRASDETDNQIDVVDVPS